MEPFRVFRKQSLSRRIDSAPADTDLSAVRMSGQHKVKPHAPEETVIVLRVVAEQDPIAVSPAKCAQPLRIRVRRQTADTHRNAIRVYLAARIVQKRHPALPQNPHVLRKQVLLMVSEAQKHGCQLSRPAQELIGMLRAVLLFSKEQLEHVVHELL